MSDQLQEIIDYLKENMSDPVPQYILHDLGYGKSVLVYSQTSFGSDKEENCRRASFKHLPLHCSV